MTEMQAMTQSVHTGCIDAFGIAIYHRQFVAVSRCSILTPAGLTRGQRGEA
jgi:hypothetical protein